jgi:hypothetical protein
MPPPNYREPKLNQHTHSFLTERSPQQMEEEGVARLKAAMKNWGPDLLALPWDAADALTYVARKIAQGQSQRPVPSLGAGEAARRWAKRSTPRAQTELSVPYEETGPEAVLRFVNPLFAMSPLKALALATGMSPGALEASAPLMAGVVKGKGGNWLHPGWGGVLEDMGYNAPKELPPLPWWDPTTGELFTSGQAGQIKKQIAINNWISGPLRKYLEQRVGSPDDEIRQLMDQGISHFDVMDQEPRLNPNLLATRRVNSPMGDTLATTPEGQRWEDLTDSVISPSTALRARNTNTIGVGYNGPTYFKDLPWLNKVSGDTPVYEVSREARAANLGLYNLTDAIEDALQAGTLRADNLNKLSVADAVRLRHSQDRAKLKAEEELMKSSLNSPVLKKVKDYPDSDLAWYQISPQSHRYMTDEEANRAVLKQLQDVGYSPGDPNWESQFQMRKQNLQAQPGPVDLQQALDYEGEKMGHCVGGYCHDVDMGDTNIYTLRDSKGEPHVTVEVRPDKSGFDASAQWDLLPQDLQDDLIKDYGMGSLGWNHRINNDPRVLSWMAENQKPSPSIAQIRGKENLPPVDKYLPAVQDFVRTQGPWSEIGDFSHTGLFNLKAFRESPTWSHNFPLTTDDFQVLGSSVVPDDLLKKLPADQDYLTPEEFRKALGFDNGK